MWVTRVPLRDDGISPAQPRMVTHRRGARGGADLRIASDLPERTAPCAAGPRDRGHRRGRLCREDRTRAAGARRSRRGGIRATAAAATTAAAQIPPGKHGPAPLAAAVPPQANTFWMSGEDKVQGSRSEEAETASGIASEWQSAESSPPVPGPSILGPMRLGSQWLLAARVPVPASSPGQPPLSRGCIGLILDIRSCIVMPESASKRAGTWAAILVISPVSLLAPMLSPSPVETMVILSTFDSGSDIARTTSAMLVIRRSTTAAWVHSWYASAFTFIAFASASPFWKMIDASASPWTRMTAAWASPPALVAEARPSASMVRRERSAAAMFSMRCRSISDCFRTVAMSSFS